MSHGHDHDHDHDLDGLHRHDDRAPLRILAIDVGAGTQDVLIYESDKAPENCFKLVLPSQTQVVARRNRLATAARCPIHLTGVLMGGASGGPDQDHLTAGCPVTVENLAGLY